jgi:type IV secretion system protein VirB4
MIAILPIDFPRWPELKRWLKEGLYGWLFDNEDDALDLSADKVGLDITYLIDKVEAGIADCVYWYLLYRMEERLEGRLTAIVCEEAWQVLASPFWRQVLAEKLPTIRKKNGFFIFLTQSPKTVASSAISHIVFDNLATLIVFPNPLADSATYQGALQLTNAEFKAVRETPVSDRFFLYKQGREAMLCKANFSSFKALIPVLSGNAQSVKRVEALIQEVGEQPQAWLPLFLEEIPS